MKQNNVLGLRILAYIIDFVGLMLVMLLSIAFIGLDRLNNNLYLGIVFTLAIVILYLCKDILKGRSLGKRIMGLKVYSKTKKLNTIKYFFRNLFLAIWFIEIIVMLISSDRKRLGDLASGTYVDKFPINN
ncbi:RDD family protein [Halobacillus yeomjeoni]|uniref:RDD family protein n=1 Tax=Halobacillus yeomjeoni TaxID=311194 RepID=UPI001CD4D4DB|nr:RDD family protein [Halobacillus yeomjeoni]MCA0983172.1 RDD family protein [Halobacillus yeomjeoni]